MASRLSKLNQPIVIASATVVISIGSFCIEFVPHTWGIDKYKKIVQKYKLAQEEPLNENVKILFNQVLDDLKIDEYNRKNYRPFTVTGFNLFQAGICNDRFGAIIGIPTNYTYKDKFSVESSQIRIGYDQEPLNIYHPATEDLLESLVLSDKAKKFGIAREILMNQKGLPLFYSIESPAIICTTVIATDLIGSKFKLHNKPMPIRMAFYGLSALVGFAVWFQIRDILNTYFEKKVDKELSQLGPEYIEGGKEFYDKLLKRNIALRTLLGVHGAKTFNRDGDEIFFIRQRTTPISRRKKFFSEFTFNEEQESLA